MILQATTAPGDALTGGAIFVLVDAVMRTWPVCTLIVIGIWRVGRASKSIESLKEAFSDSTKAIEKSLRENRDQLDKRLDSHSETLGKHESRISKTEAASAILLNHTGLTAP